MRRVPRTRWDQAGGATIEFTGVTAAAAVLVVAVLLAGATVAPGVGDRFRWALCKVTTLGQGACGTPTSPAAHVPPQPCVVQADTRSLRTEVAVLVVTAANGRRFEVARLSDGRYRVTQLLGESVGLETGIGGGVTVTVNDRTVGASATAEAGVALDMGSGRVWYTRDPREVQRMLSEDSEDAVETAVIGSGPVRFLWEAGQDGVGWVTGNGDYELPDADETYAEAGIIGNAEAEITGGADRAGASGAVTRVLGTRTTRNGSTTVCFRSTVQGAAGVQLLGADGFEGSQVAGEVELVTAATYDAGGVLRDVSVTAVAEGESKGAVSALFGGSGDPSGGSDDAGRAPSSQPDAAPVGSVPVEEAPEGLGPIDPPDGFTEVAGEGFTLHAPVGFTSERRTSSNGEPMLVLTAGEGGAGGEAPTVGVVREVRPPAGALEQSLALESAKRLVDEATGVRRTVVSWPGADAAVLVEWTVQKRTAESGPAAVRNVQLLTDVGDDLAISVLAVAPAESFDQSKVAEVLRTFRPAGTAA
ncbi:MAG: hypothetical protein ACRD03_14980 [Acidimicrobiales bacterium]